jgi:hypothetical protein
MLDKSQIDVSTSSKKAEDFLFLTCLVVFLLIGLFCFSEDGDQGSFFTRSRLFWFHLIWFECIFAAFWYSFRGKHIEKLINQRQQTGAANVSLWYLWYRCAATSSIIWLISIFIPAQSHWQAVPIAIQGILIIVYALMIVFTPKTKALQMQGMEILPIEIPAPNQLADMLAGMKCSDITPENTKAIKKLSEKLRYSLPRVGKIASTEKYKQLAQAVKDFVKDSSDHSSLKSRLSNIETLLIQVSGECKN